MHLVVISWLASKTFVHNSSQAGLWSSVWVCKYLQTQAAVLTTMIKWYVAFIQSCLSRKKRNKRNLNARYSPVPGFAPTTALFRIFTWWLFITNLMWLLKLQITFKVFLFNNLCIWCMQREPLSIKFRKFLLVTS